MMALRAWLIGAGVVLASACSSQGEREDAGVDAGAAQDAGADAGDGCQANPPDAGDPCLAAKPCGNERKVGRVCTKNGGECGEFHMTDAWLCTVDAKPVEIAFCTRPCVDASDCGAGALCMTDPRDPQSTNKGCVPAACVPPPEDGGMDGGVDGGFDGGQDAGSDAGTDGGDADAGMDAG